ncbi:hypothetical protein F0P94_16660 [Adhaeribacter soli]|uniref:Uncharacterized protein n=1 Tax=Adhaeribacter soli TaxID=2607655 RepID=A0A5N1IKK2_9BACT|nr:hypothetical protein F0P94_16660 [Adhaeribacter soli]
MSSGTAKAQIDKKLCKAFLEASELYLINTPFNSVKLTTGNGRTFTFEQLVQENWPSKKIIQIDEQDFNKLKNRNQKFHITITNWIVTTTDPNYAGALTGLAIQRGKTGYYQTDHLFWLLLPLDELKKGVVPERLIYAVENIRKILESSDDNSIFGNGFYKSADYKQILKSDTLYVKESHLSYYFNSPELVKKNYPYPFKIVNDEQWLKAIVESKPNVLFVDYVRSGNIPLSNGGWAVGDRNAINIYQAKNGRLIISLYPWKGIDRKLEGSVFKKFVK